MALRKPLDHFIDNDVSATANKHFDLENSEILGSGMSGTVFLLQDHVYGLVALKWINIRDNCNPIGFSGCSVEQQTKMFKTEVNIMRSCKHQNLMSVLATYRMKDSLCIMMPYMSGGSLSKSLPSLKIPQIARYFFQIADAVKYLHAKKIVHGDIKPGNILISADDQTVLTDFGLSRCVPNHSVEVFITEGTRGYLAPEVNDSSRVNPFKVDMYAIGMTLWTMAFKKSPRRCKNHLKFVEKENLPPSLKHILQCLLQRDPNLRPSAAQVVSGDMP